MEFINPKQFGLSARTQLIKKSNNEYIIEINRKSRIVMKDAQTLLNKMLKIKRKIPNACVCLRTGAPVCSKSIQFLSDHDIEVIPLG